MIESVSDLEGVMNCNQERFRKFFHALLDQCVYIARSAYEAGFVSAAHGREIIEQTLDAAERAFVALD
ncbi:MAG: hypothetical protein ACRER2_18815 [Methylococcales bacterium]